MIPTKPPPSFREIDRWSPEFIDFVSLCLVKNPEERASATDLLQHEFIKAAKPNNILTDMIAEAKENRENQTYTRAAIIQQANKQFQYQPDFEEQTEDCGTLVPSKNVDEGELTMIAHSNCDTLVPDSGTMIELQSNLGTMVINEDLEESTMKRHDTNPDKPKYRPLFLEHFDKKESSILGNAVNMLSEELPKMIVPPKPVYAAAPTTEIITQEVIAEQPQQPEQIQPHVFVNVPVASAPTDVGENLIHQIHQQQQQQQYADNLIKYQRMNTMDSDYEFVSLTFCNFHQISLFFFVVKISQLRRARASTGKSR